MSQEADEPSRATLGRRLLRTVDSGILSTMSRELPGYPFGSVTPYMTTLEGEVVIYVSGIAQHTANMKGDPKVSLTVIEQGSGNQQALGRVTVIGDAGLVPEAETDRVAQRYFRFFPEAEGYAGTHDFAFYWIEPQRVRYIGGFGKIFWIEKDEWRLATPQWAPGEQGIIDHMNADHADALERIVAAFAPGGSKGQGSSAAEEAPRLIAVDPEGTHLRAGDSILYAPFAPFAQGTTLATSAFDMESVRNAMIRLAKG